MVVPGTNIVFLEMTKTQIFTITKSQRLFSGISMSPVVKSRPIIFKLGNAQGMLVFRGTIFDRNMLKSTKILDYLMTIPMPHKLDQIYTECKIRVHYENFSIDFP